MSTGGGPVFTFSLAGGQLAPLSVMPLATSTNQHVATASIVRSQLSLPYLVENVDLLNPQTRYLQ